MDHLRVAQRYALGDPSMRPGPYHSVEPMTNGSEFFRKNPLVCHIICAGCVINSTNKVNSSKLKLKQPGRGLPSREGAARAWNANGVQKP